ncbi:MAG: FAD-dependent oxidoreductase [Alphaproteobacteria bacterium]|nr:FAD-dependent oxidoreductase [Alphaproteobacteria bacterium]
MTAGRDYDVLVLGGGLVGAAIAHGLTRRKLRVAVLDEGDLAFRASRGNFGLVWVQGKGRGMPAYADWARLSADLWPEFSAELEAITGQPVYYRKPGGLALCLSESEMEERATLIRGMHNQQGPKGYDCQMLDRKAVREMLPQAGPAVVGASYCPHDGHTSPLHLLRALHTAITQAGNDYLPEHRIEQLEGLAGGGFRVVAAGKTFAAPKVVLAAGLGNPGLGRQLGLNLPIRPQRGQILVTERLPAMFHYPINGVRQTAEGSIMLGSSQEEVGFNNSTSVDVLSRIASRAVRAFPVLAGANLVRTWGALRVLAPDEFPIYLEAPDYPGAFIATCHSGVSLAGAHALRYASYVAEGRLPAELAPLHVRRFDVQTAARTEPRAHRISGR